MIKIYKIVDNTNGNIYIGKTEEKYLSSRLAKHKYDYKRGISSCMSREIIKNGDYKIELIEETQDETRERYWILNTDCINNNIPGRTNKEYYKDNKDKYKEYKKDNKKHYKEYYKNRDKIRNNWYSSMGGRPSSNNLSLLKIDPNLFN